MQGCNFLAQFGNFGWRLRDSEPVGELEILMGCVPR